MTERGLLQAILEDPQFDGVRLVYADWLEEHGESERAEFIRVQCELEPIRRRYEDERVGALRLRESDILRDHQDRWLGDLQTRLGKRWYGVHVIFRRGFPDTIALPVQWYLDDGPAIHQALPLLRRVQLYRLAGLGTRLAQFPIPETLDEIDIACWISGADAEAIAGSRSLSQLQALQVWLGNRMDEGEDELVCRALARCSEWPRLRELRVIAACDYPEGCRPAFDLLAGSLDRPVASFVDPWSRPYVFAPGGYFAGYFPGRLPGGEQVFGMRPPGRPEVLVLLLFDSEGNAVGEREVALPGNCVHGTYRGWEAGREINRQAARYLQEELGHEAALIRVKDLHFAGERLVRDYPYHFEDEMGWPDHPDTRPEEAYEGTGGHGALLHNWISSGSFVFNGNGADWWVNESGDVTST
jgi:uncharacterized protein (TIGR02996 family)